MLDDDPTTAHPLPLPVDDEETDRIAAKFAAQLTGDPPDLADGGLKIDRYINAEVRARGGMGRVFVAYDPTLDRTVAIKALPVGLSPHEPGAEVPRREGKALAKVDHPNVVRVLEVIEHRGLTCLVLEHVDGPHLGDWLKAVPRDWREILHKFLQAGDGLAAVHRAGFVHCDFKPANVVVGPGNTVKLIDFGLATRPGARRPGDAEDRAGTPRYMAPEQIHGRDLVDARSDQFSFCVALYEALFRAHPYISADMAPSLEQDGLDTNTEQATRRTIFEQIAQGTARRPGWSPPGLPPTIVPALLRGLAPAPHQRHPSIAHLLTELRRDPRRTRRRVLAGIAGVLALTAGIYWAVRPESCRPPADELAQIWGGRRDSVALRLARFGGAPLASLDRAAERLARARHAACDARVRGDRRDTDFARDACLWAQQGELAAILRQIERSDDQQLAQLVANLSELPSSDACEDPARLRFSCVEDFASTSDRTDSVAALLAGDFVRGQSLAEAALRKAELHGAVGSQARSRVLLGRVAYERGDWARAVEHLTKALDLAEPGACFQVAADTYHWLVKLAAFDERVTLAQAELYARWHGYRLSTADPAARAGMLNNRALLAERRSGDLPGAEQLLHAAIALRRPEHDQSADQADSYLNLASVLLQRGELDRALAALKEADDRRSAAVGPSHPDHAKHLRNRGLIEEARGSPERAIASLEAALEQAKLGLGTDAPGIGEIHLALARVHDHSGHREAALAAARAAADLYTKLPSDDLRRIEGLEGVAQMLIDADLFAEALPHLDAAERLMRTIKASSVRRGTLAFKQAEALNGLGRHVEAERHASAAVRHFDEAALPASHDLRAHAGLILGEALEAQGRWREAVAPFEQTVAIWQASGANPERLAWAWWGLARSLCRLPDRHPEATRAADEARKSIDVIEPDRARHNVLQQQLAPTCHLR